MSDNDKPKADPNAPRVIQPTVGPYAGAILQVSPADADAAIKEGWARDPHEKLDPDKPPAELTDEQRAEVLKKAEAAARKLRGEPEAEQPAAATRDQTAKPARGDYATRNAAPKA